jgi:uncharacterized membrane protein (DUF485 family)
MKPVVTEDATQKLRDLIDATEKEFNHELKITPGEAKRIELIRRMKEDTDKKEYMIMFNGLIIGLLLTGIVHFFMYNSIFTVIGVVLGLVYYLFTRHKLKLATYELAEHKNNFDKYLWEGYHLKEMRYSAVKLAYFLFFPLVAVFFTDIMSTRADGLSISLSVCIAAGISAIGWLIFFADDKNMLETIESDLNSLQYL